MNNTATTKVKPAGGRLTTGKFNRFGYKSPTFCSVPWTQIATNSGGNFRVCCNALPGLNLVRDEKGSAMHVSQNSIDEVWNSETYKIIREQMLKGEEPDMCTRCFREEASGVQSARQKANEKYSVHSPKPISEMNIKYLDLRLGNLCNLKCRMCNPYASSKWVDEWNLVSETAELVPNFSLDDTEKNRLHKLDWPQNESTWKHLEPLIESIEEIYLTGGEPFLSLQQSILLQKMIQSGRAKDVILKYNTNLTVIPKKVTDEWAHFKRVDINCSLDAYGPLNDYIRGPSKWKELRSNFDRLRSLQAEGFPLKLGIHIAVQIYNIFELANHYTLFEEEMGVRPYTNILNHPHCLNIRTLPENLKVIAEERLSFRSESREIVEVINYMLAEDWSTNYWREFLSYTRKLDSVRGQSILDHVPELAPSFRDDKHDHQLRDTGFYNG